MNNNQYQQIPIHVHLIRIGLICGTSSCLALAGTVYAGGGDDPFSAVEIAALPFTDAGSTIGLTDQFDVVCPFVGSTSPDAWYFYTASQATSLFAKTCESAYDTKLYVLDADFNVIACNDDGCSDSKGNPYRSLLLTPLIDAGNTAYVVVDGWSGDLGEYTLEVEAATTCAVSCPDGGLDEGEDCGSDSNGGCNASPFAIQDVSCGDTVCGSAWADGGTRDTDWYRLPALESDAEITFTVTGEFTGAYFYFGENPDCDTVGIVEALNLAPCETGQITVAASGETWWFAGVSGFEGFPCDVGSPVGNDYVISWSCGLATAVQWRAEDGGNGNWYLIDRNTSNLSWSDAQAFAESVGGHLVTIASESESAFIESQLPSQPCSTDGGHYYIGLYQEDSDPEPAGFRWVTGEAVAFTAWAPGQPDNSTASCAEGEDAVAMFADSGACGLPSFAFKWNDVPVCGDSTKAFIIEWSADCNQDGIIDYGQILDGSVLDEDLNGVPDCCDGGPSCPCPGDIDRSGHVGFEDLVVVLSGWGPCQPGEECPGDISGDGDGVVSFDDLITLLGNWGPCF